MQTGDTYNPALAQNNPMAPVKPFGLQEMYQQLTPEDTARLIASMQPQQQSVAPGYAIPPEWLQQQMAQRFGR
jgi:hypothetical protein